MPWMAAVLLAACTDPEIEYETRYFDVGTGFDRPLCEGDLEAFDLQVEGLESVLGADLDDRVKLFLYDEVGDFDCEGFDHPLEGCYEPRKRRIRSTMGAVDHEIVHAFTDGAIEKGKPNPFATEGLAAGLRRRQIRFGRFSPASSVNASMEDLNGEYTTAGHFTRWLVEEEGAGKMRAWLRNSDLPGDEFADVYGSSIEAFERRYYEEVPWIYPNLFECDLGDELQAEGDGWEEQVSVSCGDSNVRSVLNGMKAHRFIDVEAAGFYVLVSSANVEFSKCSFDSVDSPPALDAGVSKDSPATHLRWPAAAERGYLAGTAHVLCLETGRHQLGVFVDGWDSTEHVVRISRAEGILPSFVQCVDGT